LPSFPWPDIPWQIYAIVLAPLALIAIAAGYKYFQVRASSDWPSTPGRVVVSTSEVRDVKVMDDTTSDHRGVEQRNFANIVYEYTVSGQKLRNNRVDIGENRGNFEVEETIARYPVGADVTVYYNPKHPRDAVLVREMPKGIAGCLAIAAVVIPVVLVGGVIGGQRMSEYLAAHLSNPKLAPLVIAICVFGLFIALFGLAWHKQSALARSWPVVPGIVKLTAPELYQAADSDSGRSGPMMYRRKVLYSYHYKNIAYTGTCVTDSSSSKPEPGAPVRSFGKTYSNGAAVKVYVDPANASQSTLSPGGGAAWLMWALALGFWIGAYYLATHG
jgi:hypothetical protein